MPSAGTWDLLPAPEMGGELFSAPLLQYGQEVVLPLGDRPHEERGSCVPFPRGVKGASLHPDETWAGDCRVELGAVGNLRVLRGG